MKALWAVLVLLTACAAPQQGDVRMLAVGDSVLAWNRLQSGDIPRVAAQAGGQAVTNRAVIGATFLQSVPGQFRPGPWDWVIVNGGANDLRRTCGCMDCDTPLDALLTADGQSGAMADFTHRLLADNHRVVWLGYYGTSVAGGPFSACADALTDLSNRLALLAQTSPDVIFVDPKAVIDPANLGHYARDLAHPSATGSALIGTQIAAAIAAANLR